MFPMLSELDRVVLTPKDTEQVSPVATPAESLFPNPLLVETGALIDPQSL